MATGNPLSIARGLTTGIITVVYVLVLNFWILKDLYKLQRSVIEQVPADYQEDARRLGQELAQIWHAFLRGQVTLAIAVGILTWVMLVIVGMPNASGLALLAGVMEFLPSIGPGLSGTIGTAVALFQGSLWMPVANLTFAIVVLGLYILNAQIENIYLIPRLVGSRVRLHPAVTFVGIVSGTLVFGLLGVLLATPIIASARTIFIYIYHKLLDLEPFDTASPLQSSIRIPGLVGGRKIDAIIFDLDGTLTSVDWAATDWSADHLTWLDQLIPPDQRRHAMRRLMIALEGLTNFIISQLRRFKLNQDLDRILPLLNKIRGFPPADQLYPSVGVVRMLEDLAPQYRLVLVSTRACDDIRSFLSHARLNAETFALIIDQDSVRNLLPNSDSLLLATTHLMLEPDQMLVVSDTDANLRSARATQMATAGVLCGLGEERDLVEADLILPTTADLLEWL